MSGPPPKPTALKVLAGNPGRRPLNRREPRIVSKSPPRCPSHLNADARREWRRIVRWYRACGLLTLLDRAALTGYCQHYSRAVKADRSIEKTGLLIKTSQGNVIQNPLVGISNHSWSQVLRFGKEFGLTPASRARLEAPEQVEEDEFEAYLRKTGQMQ